MNIINNSRSNSRIDNISNSIILKNTHWYHDNKFFYKYNSLKNLFINYKNLF